MKGPKQDSLNQIQSSTFILYCTKDNFEKSQEDLYQPKAYCDYREIGPFLNRNLYIN
jgi:hypothetical protein